MWLLNLVGGKLKEVGQIIQKNFLMNHAFPKILLARLALASLMFFFPRWIGFGRCFNIFGTLLVFDLLEAGFGSLSMLCSQFWFSVGASFLVFGILDAAVFVGQRLSYQFDNDECPAFLDGPLLLEFFFLLQLLQLIT